MADVKIFRLTTGEDIIGDKISNSPENTEIKKPFVILPTQRQPGGPVALTLTPYIPYAEGDTVKIKSNNIVTEVEPKADIKSSYNSHLGTGIITPNKPKLQLID